MPRYSGQKLKLLYLADIFRRRTDEQHGVSMAEIIALLAERGVRAERKSIYDDIELLRLYGMDILAERQGNECRYYLASREFEAAELRMLADSIQASRFLTRRKSLELIGKLGSLLSEHQAGQLKRRVYVSRRVKSMNESIYYNVDRLHEALAADCRIAFRYFHWTVQRERVSRRGSERYCVSPISLLFNEENYYLVAWDETTQAIRHYRVDKMSAIETLPEPAQGREARESYDPQRYTQAHFNMFSGPAQQVTLRFENRLAGAVIDRFGAEMALVPDGEEHFLVHPEVALNEPFYGWLFSFGTGAELTAPESAVRRMHRMLDEVRALYP